MRKRRRRGGMGRVYNCCHVTVQINRASYTIRPDPANGSRVPTFHIEAFHFSIVVVLSGQVRSGHCHFVM